MSDLTGLDAGRASSLPPSGRHLLASAALLGGMTVLVKLAAFAKDWMVARRFGASDELDAFLIALVIPGYAVSVLAHSFGAAFLPGYVRAQHQQGPAAARGLAGSVLVGGTAALAAIAVGLAVVAPWLLRLVGTGFDAAKLELAGSLFYVVAGVVLAGGVSGILGAVLNAHEHFAATSLAPMAVPAVTLATLGLGPDRLGVFALAIGTLLGFVLETLLLVAVAHRSGLLPPLAWGGFDAPLRRLLGQYAPLALGSLLISSSAVVDQAFAASLGSGSVSILSYGNKLVALVLSIVAVSLATALLPRLSRMVAQGDWTALSSTLRGYGALVMIASLPGMVLFVLLSQPLVRLIFERGAFTPETTLAVSAVQQWLIPHIPFYVLVFTGFRVLSALDAGRLALWIGALNLLVNVAADFLFVQWFGVRGIAMATTLVYVVGALATMAAVELRVADLRRRCGPT